MHVGVWRPGQEVKLAPLVLIFSQKICKMEDPKQISVILKVTSKKRQIYQDDFSTPLPLGGACAPFCPLSYATGNTGPHAAKINTVL